MKLFIYTLLSLILPFQVTEGQTQPDTIVFHGRIVNDGSVGRDELQMNYHPFTCDHLLYCKNGKWPASFVSGDQKEFSFVCHRGDTLVLESMDAFPYNYTVRIIAEDTVMRNIHIFTYPDLQEDWYPSETGYRFVRLSVKDSIRTSALCGTYKYILMDMYMPGDYHFSTLKLEEDGRFQLFEHGFEIDYWYQNYYVGKWTVHKDTLVCESIADLYPPLEEERWPGQKVSFKRGLNWEMDKRKVSDFPCLYLYKFLVRRRGLIGKNFYKKVVAKDENGQK